MRPSIHAEHSEATAMTFARDGAQRFRSAVTTTTMQDLAEAIDPGLGLPDSGATATSGSGSADGGATATPSDSGSPSDSPSATSEPSESQEPPATLPPGPIQSVGP